MQVDFWIRRPLDPIFFEYAALDIVQLHFLYDFYECDLSRYPNLRRESQRYAEIHKDQRPANNQFFRHGLLPQEVFVRSPTAQRIYDRFGTHLCSGCKRKLHQESFRGRIERASGDLFCYTCEEVKRHQNVRNRRLN